MMRRRLVAERQSRRATRYRLPVPPVCVREVYERTRAKSLAKGCMGITRGG